MRMIGSVASERDAQRFSAYLLTARIEAHVEEGREGAWQVWVEHDDDLDRAATELAQFVRDPENPRYGSAEGEAARIRKEEQAVAERRRRNYTEVRTSAAWSGVYRNRAPIALAMIAISAIVFVLQQVHPPNERSKAEQWMLFESNDYQITSDDPEQLKQVLSQVSMFHDIRNGEVWRTVTPIFLHYGIAHLVFNMMWLWRFGQVIEGLKGSVRFGLLVLAVGVFSCVAQAGWQQYHHDFVGFGGMSGVNAGLFGYAWMKRKFQPYDRIYVTDQELGLMLGWLVICSTGFIGPIANAAHWGGLVVGMLIGVWPTMTRKISGN